MTCFIRIVPVIFIQILHSHYVISENFSFINLPEPHLPYYFKRYPQIATECIESNDCPYKTFLMNNNAQNNVCWGYEHDCSFENAFSDPSCPGDHTAYVQSKQVQMETFYSQADFGYVGEQLREMRIMCEPLFPHDSMLECSKNLRFCRGRNIMIDFTDLIKISSPFRYKTDVLKPGQIGNKEGIVVELNHLT